MNLNVRYKLVMASIQYALGKYRTTFLYVPVDIDGKVRANIDRL